MAFCTTCGAKVNGAFCTSCGTPVSAAGQQPPAPAPVPAPAPAAPSFQPPPVQPPPYQASPVAPPPPGVPAQRKTSPIVWILVIILGLFLLGGAAVVGVVAYGVHKVHQAGFDSDLWRRNPGLAASKMITTFNPNMEMVRINEADGTVTMRDRRNGHVVTMSFNDLQKGGFQMNVRGDDGGSFQLGGDTSRIPSWIPSYPGSKPEVAFTGSGNGGEGGTFTFKTSDSPQQVLKFYQDKVAELGLKTFMVANTADGGTIAAGEQNGRSLSVTVSTSGGQTSVAVIYGHK
jgi:hypothetical protein